MSYRYVIDGLAACYIDISQGGLWKYPACAVAENIGHTFCEACGEKGCTQCFEGETRYQLAEVITDDATYTELSYCKKNDDYLVATADEGKGLDYCRIAEWLSGVACADCGSDGCAVCKDGDAMDLRQGVYVCKTGMLHPTCHIFGSECKWCIEGSGCAECPEEYARVTVKDDFKEDGDLDLCYESISHTSMSDLSCKLAREMSGFPCSCKTNAGCRYCDSTKEKLTVDWISYDDGLNYYSWSQWSFCSVCNENKFMQEDTCVEECSPGYVQDEYYCVNYEITGNKCPSQWMQQGSWCVEECSAGYFFQNNKCELCDISCDGCDGLTNMDCIECRSGFVRQGEVC